jgi:hypothetical protein
MDQPDQSQCPGTRADANQDTHKTPLAEKGSLFSDVGNRPEQMPIKHGSLIGDKLITSQPVRQPLNNPRAATAAFIS